MQNEQRNQRMMMNNTMNAQYQLMRNGGMANGVGPNELKRAMPNRPYVAPLHPHHLLDTPSNLHQ
jgi:hypothetical protein